jgi:hypothetical protein
MLSGLEAVWKRFQFPEATWLSLRASSSLLVRDWIFKPLPELFSAKEPQKY